MSIVKFQVDSEILGSIAAEDHLLVCVCRYQKHLVGVIPPNFHHYGILSMEKLPERLKAHLSEFVDGSLSQESVSRLTDEELAVSFNVGLANRLLNIIATSGDREVIRRVDEIWW